MKFWRNAAGLLMVFHPETTHSESHSSHKDVKNGGRSDYMHENKARATKCHAKNAAFYTKMPTLRGNPQQSSGPFGRLCTNCATIWGEMTPATAGGGESLVWCPIIELTIGETPSPPRQADRGAPSSPRLMSAPRRATLSPEGARAMKSTLPSPTRGRITLQIPRTDILGIMVRISELSRRPMTGPPE